MFPGDNDALIASGLQRLGPLRKNAGNQEVASSRNEVLTEMTNMVGSAFLGVTLGCARCHDHKFDAIRQSDYYRVQAYFAQTHENEVPLASEAEQSAWKTKTEAIDKEVKELRSRMKGLKGPELADMQKKVAEKESLKPEPLPSLYSVTNDPSRISPMNLLTPEGNPDPSRRSLAASLFFAGYAGAALSSCASPVTTPGEELIEEEVHFTGHENYRMPAFVARAR